MENWQQNLVKLLKQKETPLTQTWTWDKFVKSYIDTGDEYSLQDLALEVS